MLGTTRPPHQNLQQTVNFVSQGIWHEHGMSGEVGNQTPKEWWIRVGVRLGERGCQEDMW